MSPASRTRETTVLPSSVRVLHRDGKTGARGLSARPPSSRAETTRSVPSARRSVRLFPGSNATTVYGGAFVTLTGRPQRRLAVHAPAAAGAAPVSGSERPGPRRRAAPSRGAGAWPGTAAARASAATFQARLFRFARSSGSAGFTAGWSDGATAPAPGGRRNGGRLGVRRPRERRRTRGRARGQRAGGASALRDLRLAELRRRRRLRRLRALDAVGRLPVERLLERDPDVDRSPATRPSATTAFSAIFTVRSVPFPRRASRSPCRSP